MVGSGISRTACYTQSTSKIRTIWTGGERHVPNRRARAAPTRTVRAALVAAIDYTRAAENQLFESVALWRYRSLARADMTHRCSTPRSLVEEFRSCRANTRPNRKRAFTTGPNGHGAQKIRPHLTRCSSLNQIRIVPMQLTRSRIPRLPRDPRAFKASNSFGVAKRRSAPGSGRLVSWVCGPGASIHEGLWFSTGQATRDTDRRG